MKGKTRQLSTHLVTQREEKFHLWGWFKISPLIIDSIMSFPSFFLVSVTLFLYNIFFICCLSTAAPTSSERDLAEWSFFLTPSSVCPPLSFFIQFSNFIFLISINSFFFSSHPLIIIYHCYMYKSSFLELLTAPLCVTNTTKIPENNFYTLMNGP